MKKIFIFSIVLVAIAGLSWGLLTIVLGSPRELPPCEKLDSDALVEANPSDAPPSQTENFRPYTLPDAQKDKCTAYVKSLEERLNQPTNKDIEEIWKKFNGDFYNDANAGHRNIIVFHDGTNNTGEDFNKSTNIWKLYLRAVKHACDKPIIPYYHTGVGTLSGNRILGLAIGRGIDRHIKDDYTFLVNTYRDGDKIFLFGFSRGAYIARALNGMIEYVGLLQKDSLTEENYNLTTMVDKLHDFYHQTNDGRPKFNERLRCDIGRKITEDPKMQGIALFTSEKNRVFAEQHNKMSQNPQFIVPDNAQNFLVKVIGVFDTVPAIGLDRDDYPDDYRAELYADEGYHALSLGEQRHDFRPLRYHKRHLLLKQQTLKEVWFAGGHSDVGGGNEGMYDGLERVSRQWMKKQLAQHNLFPSNSANSEYLVCGTDFGVQLKQLETEQLKHAKGSLLYNKFAEKIKTFQTNKACELDELHDGFLAAQGSHMDMIYGTVGLHWRKPQPNDVLHQSVICRINEIKLPEPHPVKEIGNVYRPANLYPCLKKCYRVEDPSYECLNGNNAMPTIPPYNCPAEDDLYDTICPGLSTGTSIGKGNAG